MQKSTDKVILITEKSDIGYVQRLARYHANRLNFNSQDIEVIILATTELASNLVNHYAREGKIYFNDIFYNDYHGLEIVSQDSGPGIVDIDKVIIDGYTSAGTLGCGLGSLKRMMDEFSIYSRPGDYIPPASRTKERKGGTIVVVRKWNKYESPKPEGKCISSPSQFSETHRNINYGFFSRALPGLSENGDNFFIRQFPDGSLLAAVIDGLGHGKEAEVASTAAHECINNNLGKSLEEVFTGLHNSLKHTRGVAASIAEISLSKNMLSYMGVGNIELRIQPRTQITPYSQPGILGYGALSKLKRFEVLLPDKWLLVMFSDGVSSRWSFELKEEMLQMDSSILSHCLVREYGSDNDDATVLVIKSNTH